MSVKESAFLYMGDLTAPKGTYAHTVAVHEEAKAALNNAATTREEVQTWVSALRSGDCFRQLLKPDGQPFLLWEDFCVTPQPHGLGYSPEAIDGIISERQSIASLDQFDQETQRKSGRPPGKTFDNVKGFGEVAPTGNTRQQALRRLRKDRPDLHAKVLADEMSPHAAMIEAGFRSRTFTVPVNPQAAARAILRHFSESELQEFLREIEARTRDG